MPDESDDLREALDRTRRGDPQSLASLFSRHRERLRKMVEFRIDARIWGRVSPSDVLQEAYIDALKRLPHYQADSDVPFFIWLRTVTIQRLIQVHRQHLGAEARNAAREVAPPREGTIAASAEKMAAIFGDFTPPSQVAQRHEVIAQVRRALNALAPVDREVLAMRHFEDLSNHEVAALLEIQPAAASKRYVRALGRLKDALEPSKGEEEGKR